MEKQNSKLSLGGCNTVSKFPIKVSSTGKTFHWLLNYSSYFCDGRFSKKPMKKIKCDDQIGDFIETITFQCCETTQLPVFQYASDSHRVATFEETQNSTLFPDFFITFPNHFLKFNHTSFQE